MTLFKLRRLLEAENQNTDGLSPDAELSGREAVSILCAYFDLDLTGLLLHGDREVDEADAQACRTQLSRVKAGEPLQYVTGRAPFMRRLFKVNEAVLIPRLDTETLANEALVFANAFIKARKTNASAGTVGNVRTPVRALDLCTGSGAIAVTLKAECPELETLATDISEEALAVARENAAGNTAADITFVCSDLFEALPEGEDFDIITCNPPYVSQTEMQALPRTVKAFEPGIALYGGIDGLEFYRRVTARVGEYLRPGGVLLFEIGDTQAEAVSGLMRAAGLEGVRVVQDLAGRDRVMTGRKAEDIQQ